MKETEYHMYKEQRKMLDHPEWAISDVEKDFLADIKLNLAIIDEHIPDYKERYKYECYMKKSFTEEQIDFINFQINEWYLLWESRITDGWQSSSYRLKVAKQQLKLMLYGA